MSVLGPFLGIASMLGLVAYAVGNRVLTYLVSALVAVLFVLGLSTAAWGQEPTTTTTEATTTTTTVVEDPPAYVPTLNDCGYAGVLLATQQSEQIETAVPGFMGYLSENIENENSWCSSIMVLSAVGIMNVGVTEVRDGIYDQGPNVAGSGGSAELASEDRKLLGATCAVVALSMGFITVRQMHR